MSTSTRVRNHLRSNVVGYLALFLTVTGGTAMAANTVFSSDIVNGEVKSVDIGTGEVGPADLLDGGVRTADILDGTVAGADLESNSVNGAKVDNNSLTSADVNSDSLTAADLATGSVGSDEVVDDSLQQVDLANDVIASAEVVNDSLTGNDIASAFGRDAAIFVDIPEDGTEVELTQASITPSASGSVLARAQGYCNMNPGAVTPGTQYQVQLDIQPDGTTVPNSEFAYHGFVSTVGGAPVAQTNWIAERVFPSTAGVPLTLSVFGYDAFAVPATNSDCSATLTLQELPDAVVQPAVASSSSGDMTGAGK